MNIFSADILEFDALRQLVGRYVGSAAGRLLLADVEPRSNAAWLRDRHAETSEAIDYLRRTRVEQTAARGAAIRIRFSDLPDTARSVATLRIEGAGLEAMEIRHLSALIDRAGDARAILAAAEDAFPKLAGMVSVYGDLRPLARELSGKINPDGTVADDASVALTRLRRDIEKQQKNIQGSLERFLKAHREDGLLQEEFVTIRNERFVVPVVAGQKRKVEGVIHSASGSGHTLFVEPLETIDLNNELVRLNEEEMREVHRILREMTDRLRKHAPEIAAAAKALARLDLLFAKADFAIDFACSVPRISEDERRIVLREARHPLLEDILRRQGKAVVPVTLELDQEHRTLLISGPNTGGKTVAMKTIGLLSLMVHSGLPVTAGEAEFPLFDAVLADVGDHQSLEHSLSSFSAHIKRVGELLNEASPESLVLLDELGRATDPDEGGALGVAVLEAFRRSGSFTFASTHLRAMKIWGANTLGVVNASMGFNEETLEPTYQLRTGAPGKSAGLDIASRLGLSPELIENARANLSGSEREMQLFLAQLHEKLADASKAEEELRGKVAAVAAREATLEKEWERKYSAKIREVEQRSEQLAKDFDEKARQTIEQITQNVDQRKASENALRKVAKTRREFQETVEKEIGVSLRPVSAGPAPLALAEGVRVRLKGVRQLARVRRLLDGGVIEVDAGFMKMKVTRDDIEEVLPPDGGTKLPRGVTFTQAPAGPSWDGGYREINVIGKRAEEAIDEVERFVDNAAMAQVQRIRIVHGHGMGVLKRAVADLLKRSPHVLKFYEATQGEGGAGATIVEMKDD
ncbi:MAG: Smr/MutS family protein [Bryobacteraceae bacterium]